MNTVTTPTTPTKLTSWTPPTWTDTVSTDGDLIECSRTLGFVPRIPPTAADLLAVTLIQRDEIQANTHNIDVLRHPVAVLVGGVSLTGAETESLVRLLQDATALIADPTR